MLASLVNGTAVLGPSIVPVERHRHAHRRSVRHAADPEEGGDERAGKGPQDQLI